jgi:hypothetical protein
MKKLCLFLILLVSVIGLSFGESLTIDGQTKITSSQITDFDSAVGNSTSVSALTTNIGTYRQVLSTSTSTDTPLNLLTGARTTFYDITLTGDCQVETPTFTSGSAQDGDSLIIRVLASGDARTISFLEGGDGTFAYGSTLASADITATVQDKTDYIGCTWNNTKKRWLIISYSKGF